MQKIYKYFPAGVFNLVFARDELCGLKCSLPQDYNDPYELLLGVDLDVPADILAEYKEIVQELPQLPTTCFSKSPVVVPMWAHYAANHSGFVLEFAVEELKKNFEQALLGDIEYKDKADPEISKRLYQYAGTRKPRHAVFVQQIAFSEAYFSKQTAWQYENECRLVLEDINRIESVNGSMILYIPLECATSIIVGKNAPKELVRASKEFANDNGLNWFELRIGRSQLTPYLNSEVGRVFQFNGEAIVAADEICESCGEPIAVEKEQCAWCSITESDEWNAAASNPFRMLDHAGLLAEYLENVRNIGRRRKS